MHTLKSYVCGHWHEATEGFRPLYDPSTEEEIARASSSGIAFGDVLDHARETGGPALRAMTFAQRGALLRDLSKALRAHRDELLDLSRRNNGTTEADGSFDLDGASGTLHYYASFGRRLGDVRTLPDDDGQQLGRDEHFWTRHVWVPRQGAAVGVNAFNFPAWGFVEKAACALLAGVPVIAKPATATAWVAQRCAEIMVASGVLPEGTFQMIVGGTGDLLERLGPQDVFAFTGSADTARDLLAGESLRKHNTRTNVEADSLNAAVLAPDADGDTLARFVRDVSHEMMQKAGQKCTAIRRVFVPVARIDEVQEALVARLDKKAAVGNPADAAVTVGPLATASQLSDAERGVRELESAGAQKVYGEGCRVDGLGSTEDRGYFFPPTLLRHEEPHTAGAVHGREVFGPVATLMPYDGTATEAAQLVALGGGTLVTSVYTDTRDWLEELVVAGGAHTGRIYIGSAESAGFGSGAALPASLHGGPGRAGGGEEVGGAIGLERYLQRLALQGDRPLVDGVLVHSTGEDDA
ncbi:MAG: 3,4-dehydroadipyl-CoA semialdehyde dehydrogenase [Thermoanaerobaculia bacterium]|nr:3,4-dehydroadipyl-CoA semialdehyde dehydrogenase [Thermoanaerobaculia bacterium]